MIPSPLPNAGATRRPAPSKSASLAAALVLGAASLRAQTNITEFRIPTAGSDPRHILAGPDGNLWFAERGVSKIARITPAGIITEFAIPTANSNPGQIVVGPDGNLWFGENEYTKVARITTAGVITEFSIPFTGASHDRGMIVGPDGNLWFPENEADRIGRITTAGVVTEFPIPTTGSNIEFMAAGPDGNVWFNEGDFFTDRLPQVQGINKIGRITAAGVVTEFPVPTANSGNWGMTAGPDGNLWFSEGAASKIGQITPAGVITEFPTPSANSSPSPAFVGPDGSLWFGELAVNRLVRINADNTFTEIPVALNFKNLGFPANGLDHNFWLPDASNQIDRVTTAGSATSFPIPTASSLPRDIVAGPDGNVWFIEEVGNKIGRVSICIPPQAPVSPKIQPVGNPNGPVTGIDFLDLSWSPPAGGTAPTDYEWAINGDQFTPESGTSVAAPPRNSNNPITLHVRAVACTPATSGPLSGAASDSPTYSPAAPVANFTASAPASPGATVTFTDTSDPQATSWLWLFGDGAIATTQSATHSFSIQGIYSVVLVASNGAGSSEKSQQQTVQSTAVVPEEIRSMRVFETTDPERKLLGGVRIAGSGSTWLRVFSGETDEIVVYLRFVDGSGRLAKERRLSIVPGQEAVYDLRAYGLRGVWTLELVSTHRFEAFLEELQTSNREKGHIHDLR